MSVEWLRVDDGRMSGRDVCILMLLEWVEALGLCPNTHHWTHYHHHSHAHTHTHTHASIHQRDTTHPTDYPLHLSPSSPLPLSYPTSQVHHHLSHPSHIIIDLHQQFSAVYPAPTKQHSTLPLLHFLSNPLQLILFITPLDHHSLSLYPASHSYQPPLHSQTHPTLKSVPYPHTLYNFPCIPTLPFPIP